MLIPVEYMESASLFCAATETIKDTENNTMKNIGKAPLHPLEILAETPPSATIKSGRKERQAPKNPGTISTHRHKKRNSCT